MTTSTGDPVMIAPDGGRLISGGAVHARLLVAHDHPSYASTFEMTVAPGFDVGAHVHTNGEEMFYVVDGELDVLCFEPTDRPTTVFFQSSVAGGHENCFAELGALLRDSDGRPAPADVEHLEARYGTEQLTAMRSGGTTSSNSPTAPTQKDERHP